MAESQSLDRREFNQLTAAALGGMLTGSLAGCSGTGDAGPAAAAAKHVCRGLNDCKGQGFSGANDCRGQGDCATFAHHECGTTNECRGQGGCGADAGKNECKGKGGCELPLMDAPWEKLRGEMVLLWKKDGKEFGDPPPKAKQRSQN